jgi:hypothetical protein
LFDLGLPCDLIGFYAYLKRVAGDKGGCWRSMPTMAKENGCSENKIRDMKKALLKKNPKLAGLSLIQIQKGRKAKDGNNLPDLITINDIWAINFQKISTGSKSEPPLVQNLNQTGSKSEPKEEPFKKSYKKQQQAAPPKPSASVAVFSSKIEDRLKELGVTTKERTRWKYSEQEVTIALMITDSEIRDNPLRTFRAALKEGWELKQKRRKKEGADVHEWVRICNKQLPKSLHMKIQDNTLYYIGVIKIENERVATDKKINLNKKHLSENQLDIIFSELKEIERSAVC